VEPDFAHRLRDEWNGTLMERGFPPEPEMTESVDEP